MWVSLTLIFNLSLFPFFLLLYQLSLNIVTQMVAGCTAGTQEPTCDGSRHKTECKCKRHNWKGRLRISYNIPLSNFLNRWSEAKQQGTPFWSSHCGVWSISLKRACEWIVKLGHFLGFSPAFFPVQFPKEHFQIVLFHYDNAVEQWDQFEWNNRVIHIQSTGQSKWYNYFLP